MKLFKWLCKHINHEIEFISLMDGNGLIFPSIIKKCKNCNKSEIYVEFFNQCYKFNTKKLNKFCSKNNFIKVNK